MDIKDLELLNLTQNESKVYYALLKKGAMRVSQIVKSSLVSSSKIYEVLDSLESKGFVKIIPDKIKQYAPVDTNCVMNMLEEKSNKIKQLKEDLKNFEHESQKQQKIFIVRGKKNFHKILHRDIGEITFAYGIKWKLDSTDKNIIKRVKEKQKKGIKGFILLSPNVPQKNIDFWQKHNLLKKTKTIDTDGVAVDVHDNGIMISVLELDSTVFIDSPKVAKVFQQLFEGYYKSKSAQHNL